MEPVTEDKWQAIINNDASYDGHFFYAVKTTGIFCRPSCKSRLPHLGNIGIFLSADHALTAKFRPCKRCKPTGERLPDAEWVEGVTEYIDRNYPSSLTLELLAEVCHGSPSHLHRTFKRVTGITPVEYIQHIRIHHAKELLVTTDKAIAEVGSCVGLSNPSYFITLFKKRSGYTPASYRQLQLQIKKEALPNGK